MLMDSRYKVIFRIFTEALFNSNSKSYLGNEFIIPNFQRYYAWDKPRIYDLLRDIDDSISMGDKSFFLGPILLLETDDSNNNYVIDGQQRLVTLSIIMRQIVHRIDNSTDDCDIAEVRLAKRCLIKLKEEDSTEIINLDKIVSDDVDPRINFWLPSNESDFKNIVGKQSKNAIKNKPLRDALTHVDNYLINKNLKDLKDYLSYLLRNVRIIAIRVEKGHDISKIFETLNDRGLELSQLELFKNFSLGYLTNSSKNNDYIMQCHEKLGYDDKKLERYFYIYSQVTNGYDKENNSTKVWYRCWKDAVIAKNKKNTHQIKNHLKQLLSTIHTDISFYTTAISKDDNLWVSERGQYKDIAKMVDYLSEYKIVRSLTFVLVKKYMESDIQDFKELYRCIKIIYVFFSRVSLVYSLNRTERVEEIIVKTAFGVNKAKSLVPPYELLDMLKANVENWKKDKYIGLIDDDFFISNIANMQYDEKDQRPMLILKKIVHKNQGLDLEDTTSDLSVEHVLSKSVEHYNDNWDKHFNLQDFLSYRYRLGNLTLLRTKENAKLSSDDKENFNDKIAVYQKSDFKVTKDICNFKSWNRGNIEERQKEMAKALCKELSFPPWALN